MLSMHPVCPELMFASEIPIPVSATAIRILTLFSPSISMDAILTRTLPSEVNLIAFDNRQFNTC